MIWDAEKQIYLDDAGQPIPPARVRSWVDDWAAALVLLFISRANDVLDAMNLMVDPSNPTQAEINAVYSALNVWNYETRYDLRIGMFAATALAFGGMNNINLDDWEIAENFIAEQINYFDNFVAGVFAGSVALNGIFAARTGMYAASLFPAYINAGRLLKLRNPLIQERRRLGATDHCVDCLEQAALGWVQGGTLRRIGDSVCKSRCRCWFQFRLTEN